MAVIRKPRLQTNPNILFACLSVTDLLVGMTSLPLHVSIALLLLLGNRSHTFCHLTLVFNASVQILCGASLFHLVLISAERYFTIKHSFVNGILITKARLITSSVVAWIVTLILVIVPIVTRITVILIIRQIAAVSLIVAFQVFKLLSFPGRKVKISKGETGLKAYKYNNRSSCRLLHDSMDNNCHCSATVCQRNH